MFVLCSWVVVLFWVGFFGGWLCYVVVVLGGGGVLWGGLCVWSGCEVVGYVVVGVGWGAVLG